MQKFDTKAIQQTPKTSKPIQKNHVSHKTIYRNSGHASGVLGTQVGYHKQCRVNQLNQEVLKMSN
jgi:hypothetical protein